MSSLRLHHVTAVLMDDACSVIEDAAIIITDSRITYVGPVVGAPSAHPDDAVIDGNGLVALPGLINTHTHLGMTLFRGAADDLPLMTWLQEKIWPVEAHLTAEDVYWASLLGIAEMLRAGVTTFNDMYWHVERVADAVRESGIRGCLAGVVIGTIPDAETHFQQAVERVRVLAEEGHPRITPFFGPHAPYTVPPALLRRTVEYASELGVGIHTHLSETAAEVEASRAAHGMTPIALMQQLGLFNVPVVAAHCVHPTRAEIDILAETGTAVAHCPSSNMKLASGIAPVPAYLEAGVTVSLGTDGAGSNNTLDLLREAHLAALLHKVGGDATAVSAPQALALATRHGAQALGLPDLGTLEAGKLADITLLNFHQPHLTPSRGRTVSHLVYAAKGGDVDTVIVHGQVLLRHGQFTQLDIAEITAHVEESAHRLFGS